MGSIFERSSPLRGLRLTRRGGAHLDELVEQDLLDVDEIEGRGRRGDQAVEPLLVGLVVTSAPRARVWREGLKGKG